MAGGLRRRAFGQGRWPSGTTSSSASRPARASPTYWHQDEAYWGRNLDDKGITGWIPLQDVDCGQRLHALHRPRPQAGRPAARTGRGRAERPDPCEVDVSRHGGLPDRTRRRHLPPLQDPAHDHRQQHADALAQGGDQPHAGGGRRRRGRPLSVEADRASGLGQGRGRPSRSEKDRVSGGENDRVFRPGIEPGQPLASEPRQVALDQPGELHRREGQGRHVDRRPGRQRRAGPGPGLEGLALCDHPAGRDLHPGRHRGLGRDPADLDDAGARQVAPHHPARLLGRPGAAVDRVPGRRLLRLRLGELRPGHLAGGLREPRPRLQLLLGDAVPQARADDA